MIMRLCRFAVLVLLASLVAIWAPPPARTQQPTLPPDAAGIVSEQHALDVLYTMVFFFFHELGHALITELELPVVGPEEDVADELAIFTLIDAGDKGYDALFSAAQAFTLMWEVTDRTKLEV